MIELSLNAWTRAIVARAIVHGHENLYSLVVLATGRLLGTHDL